jgi:phage terminase large subunit
MQIPVNFIPRDYQAMALAALDAGVILSVWCWSRRGGKDFTAFGYAVKKMVETPMNVVLVFPTKEQGKNSFWENVENDGFKTIDHIPSQLIESQDNSNMRIRLKNGSTFQVLGATDPDALRGANGKLYIFSEFVDIPGAALDVIRPIIAVNGGQIIIQSTPKIDGISGGTFKILFDRALKNWTEGDKTQYASRVTADAYLSAKALEDIRQETIAKNGNDFWFQQEFMCSWGQVSSTSYYGGILTQIEKRGYISEFPYNPAFPAFTSWDYGMSDSTAIEFWQYINKQPIIIDYFETHDIALGSTLEYVKSKPYNLMWHFFPHDLSVRDSDAIARIEKVREAGLINSSLLRREPKEDGIKRAVELTANTRFNEATTENLRRKLGMYKRKFNPLTGDYEGPEHKTESHAADSHRYMAAAIDQEFDPKTGLFLYSPDLQEATYDSDTINVAPQYDPGY